MSTYLLIFLLATGAFLALTILSLLGIGKRDLGEDIDGDYAAYLDEGDRLSKFLTLTNCINFAIGFGLLAWLVEDVGYAAPVVIGAGVVGGGLSAWVFKQVADYLAKAGAAAAGNRGDALGHDARVTNTIGGNRSRRGKVAVYLRHGMQEHEAVTDFPEDIPSQALVTVVGMDGTRYVVMPKI